MFRQTLANYLTGSVRLHVTGPQVERFVNMAAARGILLWDVVYLSEGQVMVSVRISAVRPLKHIARRTGCRFRIVGKEGFPFWWYRTKRRKMLIGGGFFFVAALYIMSSLVFFIDVTGCQRVDKKDILQVAYEHGLHRGAWKHSINTREVELALLEHLPDLAWAGVSLKGMAAQIEVVEKVKPPQRVSGPAHIVARRGGLIQEVLVVAGTPVVKKGDTVLPGQILISGVVYPELTPGTDGQPLPPSAPPSYVTASGIVRARVWYEGWGEVNLREEGERYTGQEYDRLSIKLGDKEIILKGGREVPFPTWELEKKVWHVPQWRNINLPVEVIRQKYKEKEHYVCQLSWEEARNRAEEIARQQVQQQMSPQAQVILRRVEENKPPGGQNGESRVRVRLLVEAVEEIGEVKPFQPAS